MMRGSPRQVSPFAFFCGADLVDDLGILAAGTGVSPYGQNIHRGRFSLLLVLQNQ